MTASLVMVPEEMSLQGAAHLLAQARVSGAPVVNHQGRCVGVLSATDFVQWAGKCQQGAAALSAAATFCAAWQIVDPSQLPQEAVHNYMTRDPVIVAGGTSIGALAKMMVDAHIHRVIVKDSVGKPVGIVSSTDVLAAVARASQEAAARGQEPESRGQALEASVRK
jgi:CBS domain-containing protein